MAAELPRPGVEVVQVLRTVSPTIVTPTLQPVIVGVCKQILELYTSSASGARQLNSQALEIVPAVLATIAATGSPPVFTGLNGLLLALSFNSGPTVTVTFADAAGLGLSPSAVAAQINAKFATEGITEGLAFATTTQVFIRTVGTGSSQYIEIKSTTSAGLLTIFGGADPGSSGWALGRTIPGVSGYDGHRFYVPYTCLPDPNGNIEELTIEPDTVRAFISSGGSSTNIKELSRSEAHLRRGAGATAAYVTGSVALAGLVYGVAGDLDGKILTFHLDALAPVTVTFGAAGDAPGDMYDVVQQINAGVGAHVASIYTSGGNDYLRLTSLTTGTSSVVHVTGGNAQSILGLTTPNDTATGYPGVYTVDDGDGDVTTPILYCTGQDFTASATAAAMVGIKNISGILASFAGTTLTLSVDGRAPQTMTLGTYGAVADLQTAVETFFGPTVLQVTGGTLQTFTSQISGEGSTLRFLDGSSLPLFGLVPYADATIAATTWRDLGGSVAYYDAVKNKKLRVKVNGTTVEHTFGAGPFANFAAVLADINGDVAFAAIALAADAGSEKLRISAKLAGGDGTSIEILAATSAESNYIFGWNTGDTFTFNTATGTGYPVQVNDDVYVDGTYMGRVIQVAPSGRVAAVKLDREYVISTAYGSVFSMVSKRLPKALAPAPELVVDAEGNVTFSAYAVRDTLGLPVMDIPMTLYVTYRAVRRDVTALAAQPGLLRMDSTTQLEAAIPPIAADNPLALGMYFAMLNAPTCQIAGLGVDEVSADAPFGTVEAFTRAAEFLEAYEVYGIAPLTHDATVGQVFAAHVTAMSEPASKGERIVYLNWNEPTRAVDTLVASGEGDSLGTGSSQFNTKVANLGSLLLAAGVNPVGTIAASSGVFLDIYSDDAHYSIQSISGGTVTIRTAFSPGENDDGYYATSVPAGLLVDEVFAVRIRGAELTTAGVLDKQKVAETYQAMAQGVRNRRVSNIVPDSCAATIGGVEQVIDGFYLAAATAGARGQNPPQQSFTNFPLTGFTRVIGSNNYFSTKQLNIIAAGGNYIIVQDAAGVPVMARMGLTTDMTSIETRTDSITPIVDYTAKFLRGGLKNFIGRFNITSSFVDTLSHVTQGLLGYLQDSGVLLESSISNIIQDETNPDTVLIDVVIGVPYPCNYIRLTLIL